MFSMILLFLLTISSALGHRQNYTKWNPYYKLYIVKAENEHQLYDFKRIIKNAPDLDKTGYLLIRESEKLSGLVYHSKQSQPQMSIQCTHAALQIDSPFEINYEDLEQSYDYHVYKIHPTTNSEVELLRKTIAVAPYLGILYSGMPVINRSTYLLLESSRDEEILNDLNLITLSPTMEYEAKFGRYKLSKNNCSIETTMHGGYYGSVLTNIIESSNRTSIPIKDDEIEAFRQHLPRNVRRFVIKPLLDPFNDLYEEHPADYLNVAFPIEDEDRNNRVIQELFLTLVRQISEEEKLDEINTILDKAKEYLDKKEIQENINMLLHKAIQDGYTKISDSLRKRSEQTSNGD